jgi:hypothetical protein
MIERSKMGYITQFKGKIASIIPILNKYQIVINRGLEHNMRIGDHYYIINSELEIPIIIAKIRITAIFDKFSSGILLPYKEYTGTSLKISRGNEVMLTNNKKPYSEIIIVRKSTLKYFKVLKGV